MQMTKPSIKEVRVWLLSIVICLLIFVWPGEAAAGPGDVVNCSAPYNISNSAGYSSVDPFLLADPAGLVHLFWAERKTGEPDAIPNVPDSLMYAVWNGEVWSEPIDIFISPPENFNKKIAGIRAVIDDQGIIHLVWLGPDDTFFYSSARADKARSGRAWRQPVKMANDQTGTQYSIDLAYEPPQTIHILYGRSQEDDLRSISYVRSDDGGYRWSELIDVHIFTDPERGASNTRLLVTGPNQIYASWTEWDTSGNGQGVYVTHSLDGGQTWDFPVLLDERTGNEYERDWMTLAVLDENQMIAFWEGGFRAYPQAQYSYDGGLTWSEPIDTFYWLIADNGYINMVRDSAGRMHAFLPRRVREGYDSKCLELPGCANTDSGDALWHSVWEGGTHWREPQPVGGFTYPSITGDLASVGGNYISVAFNGGNEFVTAWFDYTYFELMVMQCEIEDAPAVAPQPWPAPTPTPTMTPTSMPEESVSPVGNTPEPTRPLAPADSDLPQSDENGTDVNPGLPVLLGVIPALALIMAIALFQQFRNRVQ